jgi:hypothetical protein
MMGQGGLLSLRCVRPALLFAGAALLYVLIGFHLSLFSWF